MSTSLICAEDYLDTATRTATSEDAQFPASNLYDQSIRGRVWRSAGYFNITSASKGIVFDIGGGNVTANIAEAEYTNITTFLAAVVTALNAAAAGTYTATQNSTTKKIVLTKSAGTFELKWTNAGSTAADVLGFDVGADDTGALTYTADYIRCHTSERLVWDMGASSNPDIFMAIGKKNQAIKISSGATIKLQGNTTNAWTSPQYDVTLSYDEFCLLKVKTDGDSGLHASALRYWSLYIVDKDNVNGYVELSNIYLGEYYAPDQGRIQFPFKVNGQDYSSGTTFQSGAKAFTRRQRNEQFSFGWYGLTTTEKEQFESFQRDLGSSKPFYMVFDPDSNIGSTANYNTRYVRFSGDTDLTLSSPGVWASSWSLEEML